MLQGFHQCRISLSAGRELDVEAGLQQHGDAQQRFGLLVNNQCLISHEDGVAFSVNRGAAPAGEYMEV